MDIRNIKQFRGLCIQIDTERLRDHLVPASVDIDGLSSKKVAYFKEYGFNVSTRINYVYQKYNGIVSEKYIPVSLYWYYIQPYLVNLNLSLAYVDKNMYHILFPDINQPKCLLRCINGKLFGDHLDDSYSSSSNNEEQNLLNSVPAFIIKPSIQSGCGRDVELVKTPLSLKEIEELFKRHGSDFIIQEIVRQHPDMAVLNPTSLNTIRLYSFLPVRSSDYVILGAAVRFGGHGSYKDNASAGGGFCKINDDGSVEDRIYQYCNWEPRSLKNERGIHNLKIPSYDKVKEICLSMHRKLPYIDLVGWDIAIGEDGEPILLELNQYPDSEIIQIINGPMFGDFTDDLMEEISKYEISIRSVVHQHFLDKGNLHNYNFDFDSSANKL